MYLRTIVDYTKPSEMSVARSILRIAIASTSPTRAFSLRLSSVRICSSRTTESLASPNSPARSSTWVGSFALVMRLVTAQTITVGENLLPPSFCMIRTGRTPPCSDPMTGLKSA